MSNWKNEAEAREQIKALVAEYYHDFKEKKTPFQEGDRVTYAARVFDEKEMCALTDATLDFWLTTGRFADEFRFPRFGTGARYGQSVSMTIRSAGTDAAASFTFFALEKVTTPPNPI